MFPPKKLTLPGRNSCATRTACSALEFCGALVGVGPHSIRVQTVTHQEYPKTIQNADCHDLLPIGKTKQQRSPLAKGLVTESLSLRAVLPLCVAENHTHLPGKTARQSAFFFMLHRHYVYLSGVKQPIRFRSHMHIALSHLDLKGSQARPLTFFRSYTLFLRRGLAETLKSSTQKSPQKYYLTPQGRNSCATRTAGSALESERASSGPPS